MEIVEILVKIFNKWEIKLLLSLIAVLSTIRCIFLPIREYNYVMDLEFDSEKQRIFKVYNYY